MDYSQLTMSAAPRAEDTNMMKFVKGILKPALVGLAAYGIAHYMNSGAGGLPFFGNSYAVASVVGASVFAGSLVANNISEWVIGNLNQYRALGDFEKAIVNPVLTGVIAIGVLMLGGAGAYTRGLSAYGGIIATAAISEAVGDYAYRNYVANWIPQ